MIHRTCARGAASLLLLLALLAALVMPAGAADSGKILRVRETPVGAELVPAGVRMDPEDAEAPSVSCQGAILLDLDSGRVLWEKNADTALYPASTTKLMTAYLCLKYGNLDDSETVTYAALADVSYGASALGLRVGETVSLRGLLQSLMVISACDSAGVIATHISGSVADFVELMNREARALGCKNTNFLNAHGLHRGNHYSCARDIAIIASACMQYGEFRDIVSHYYLDMGPTSYRGARTLENTNLLLPGSGYGYSYEYATGIKTGYTSQAGYCLVASAEKDGLRLLSVVLGAGSEAGRVLSSRNLLQWGYANYDPRSLRYADWSLDAEDFLYDGTEKTPGVHGSFQGEALAAGRDYSLRYEDNLLPGTAAAVVTGIGDYSGTVRLPFTIRSPLPFEDVSVTHWGFGDVLTGWQAGLIRGRSDTAFAPDEPVTRGDAAVILHRYFGSPAAAEPPGFGDLTEGYQYDAIRWAAERGIMQGYSDTVFAPLDSLTRQDFAVILHRLAGRPEAAEDLGAFTDAGEISGYAREAMEWAVAAGILRGRGGGVLAPRDHVTRTELVAMLLRYRAAA